MEQSIQIGHIHAIFEHLANKTTAMADTVYRNDVTDYTCREQLARESALLFRDYPLHMAFSCELSSPGDYVTDDFSGVPVLLVRGVDGRMNAFMNVCRHRGAPVAHGCGQGKRAFACPYHGWTYDTQGRLIRVPDGGSFKEVDRATSGLRRLPVQEKYGMIWAKTQPGPDFEIDHYLQGLERDLAAYRLDTHHHYETRVIERRMNWKLVIDTFLETYHVRVLHRATIKDIIHSNLGLFDAFGPNLRDIHARKTFDELRDQPESEWDLVKYTAMVYVLFPNTILLVQGDHLETWRVYPDGDDPNASKMYVSLYTPEPAETESARRHWDRNLELLLAVVQNEDFPLGEKIQRGFDSGAQTHITFGRNEPALGHYHRSIKQALQAA